MRVFELPATPDKIKAGLDKLAKGEKIEPPKYFFGSDFYDELESDMAVTVPEDWIQQMIAARMAEAKKEEEDAKAKADSGASDMENAGIVEL